MRIAAWEANASAINLSGTEALEMKPGPEPARRRRRDAALAAAWPGAELQVDLYVDHTEPQ